MLIPKIKKVRDKKYLKRVASLPCCACQAIGLSGRLPTVVAHHKTGAGMGMKACDLDTMPLCEGHHTGRNGIHRLGVKEWEATYGKQDDHIAATRVRLRR